MDCSRAAIHAVPVLSRSRRHSDRAPHPTLSLVRSSLRHSDGRSAAMRDTDPELSVVVPMYDEEEVLPIFFERMHPLLDGLGITYELLVVDDGSRDTTAALLLEA